MIVQLGDRVIYRLTGRDALTINANRQATDELKPASTCGQAHLGTRVMAGQEFAADVCQVSEDHRFANLRVLLDGNDTHWVAAIREGRNAGQWQERDGDH